MLLLKLLLLVLPLFSVRLSPLFWLKGDGLACLLAQNGICLLHAMRFPNSGLDLGFLIDTLSFVTIKCADR